MTGTLARRNWMGIVSAEHVRRGMSLGIGQIAHGQRAPLERMEPGDWLIYYSPRERLGEPASLQEFTAIGRVTDDEVWQTDEGSFQPWRRRITYDIDAHSAPLGPLKPTLEFTRQPHWGYQLRRGIVELSDTDRELIDRAMHR